ncbi:hypothetical protein, partial [Burkholderia cenocepacia]|uniref:hypothetical protein n=1 Tax=Burkholderia cenocepacia TaxID=95486 RepID=UPI001C4E2E0E
TLQGDLRPPRPWGLFRPQTRPGSRFRCNFPAQKSTVLFSQKGLFFFSKGLTVNPLTHIIEPMMNDETGAVKAGFPD